MDEITHIRDSKSSFAGFQALKPLTQFRYLLLQSRNRPCSRIGNSFDRVFTDERPAALMGVNEAVCAKFRKCTLHSAGSDTVVLREFTGAAQPVVGLQAAKPHLILHVLRDALVGLKILGRHEPHRRAP